jgi:hypothetical protein
MAKEYSRFSGIASIFTKVWLCDNWVEEKWLTN